VMHIVALLIVNGGMRRLKTLVRCIILCYTQNFSHHKISQKLCVMPQFRSHILDYQAICPEGLECFHVKLLATNFKKITHNITTLRK